MAEREKTAENNSLLDSLLGICDNSKSISSRSSSPEFNSSNEGRRFAKSSRGCCREDDVERRRIGGECSVLLWNMMNIFLRKDSNYTVLIHMFFPHQEPMEQHQHDSKQKKCSQFKKKHSFKPPPRHQKTVFNRSNSSLENRIIPMNFNAEEQGTSFEARVRQNANASIADCGKFITTAIESEFAIYIILPNTCFCFFHPNQHFKIVLSVLLHFPKFRRAQITYFCLRYQQQ